MTPFRKSNTTEESVNTKWVADTSVIWKWWAVVAVLANNKLWNHTYYHWI